MAHAAASIVGCGAGGRHCRASRRPSTRRHCRCNVTRSSVRLGHQPPRRAHGALPAPCPSRRRDRQKAFVDWQHDVTTRDLELATREGFRSIEHIKRYTTTGHGHRPGQDLQPQRPRLSSRRASSKPIPKVGLTTFRMPYTPITFGSFAGLRSAASCSTPSAPRPHTPGLTARRRRVRGCRPLEARPLLPARRRGHARRRRARVPRRPQ